MHSKIQLLFSSPKFLILTFAVANVDESLTIRSTDLLPFDPSVKK